MRKTPFSQIHKINNVINWYGATYQFKRDIPDEYGEPTGESEISETLDGIYHSSQRSFLELVNTEGASIKSKANTGILTHNTSGSKVNQGDTVLIHSSEYTVTAVEPVMLGDVKIATVISLEEKLVEV